MHDRYRQMHRPISLAYNFASPLQRIGHLIVTLWPWYWQRESRESSDRSVWYLQSLQARNMRTTWQRESLGPTLYSSLSATLVFMAWYCSLLVWNAAAWHPSFPALLQHYRNRDKYYRHHRVYAATCETGYTVKKFNGCFFRCHHRWCVSVIAGCCAVSLGTAAVITACSYSGCSQLGSGAPSAIT